ncbi:nucleotide sugar dehydrogenase [Anaerococcus sp. AGMB09787]|uniref:nucleotide sugar dehydrogenase n=1 Tax=Anaerococcus sp. AGMB09787 TaxID=2922869 RepID=UPI001FAF6661|nr:nucleotide sugar dehydrogenase [Anaerococcus sp. AGMB09787]
MKITLVGLGYVGLSNAILLGLSNEVIGIDVDDRKIDMINNKKSPLVDKEIIEYLENKDLNLRAERAPKVHYKDSDLVILALPTNYDEVKEHFDTSYLDGAIKEVKEVNEDVTILIKSTIPIGYTESKNKEYGCDNIIFSPEFLREGRALYDCLHPSRIIVGEKSDRGMEIAELFKHEALNDPEIILMESSEAEAVKLFANTYLAMRVAYFNELDSFAEVKGLNSKDIIKGVCGDPRIGNHYNNPSFGYGGYCLPKDSMQLSSNFRDVPNAMFNAVVDANKIRKDFVSDRILTKEPKTIGIYRLVMKKGSDNFRKSAIFDVVKNLKAKGSDLIVYEPNVDKENFEGMRVVNDLDEFKKADIIVANRIDENLVDVEDKVYSRDVFNRD